MSEAETMTAFGASDHACYLWPGDSVDDRLCRAAFCAGAGWAASEVERLREARDADIERMNRALSKADYEAERAGNFENEIERMRAALLWIGDMDPINVDAAQVKFGFTLNVIEQLEGQK